MARISKARVRGFLWRRALRLTGGRTGIGPRVERWERAARVRDLAASPLLDLEFYRSRTGVPFESATEAAEHFLTTGASEGLSPTPLFQSEWYSHYTQRPEAHHFVSMFFDLEPATTCSPWFDASGAKTSMREALERFLRRAGDSTPLPVHPLCTGRPTLGSARRAALAAAARNRRRDHAVRPRFVDDWTSERIAAASDGPLVSIVMPVRDRSTVVGTAIESVLAQRYANWELIVVDDGSRDSTPAVVEQYARADERVSMVRGPAAGVCAARNSGIAAARGRYVAFLDSDNEWSPDFLGSSVLALEADTDLVGVHAAVELIDDEGGRRYLAISGDREDLVDGGNFIDLNTLVARRDAIDAIGGFDESLRRWVDYDLVIRLSALGPLELLPFVGVVYAEASDTGRISRVEVPGWEQRVLSKYVLDEERFGRTSSRDPELVSIVILSYADWWATLRAVGDVLARSSGCAVEVIVLDNGSPTRVSEILVAGLSGNPALTLITSPRNLNFSLGSNLAFTRSSGARVVFLNNDASVHEGWLPPLMRAIDEGADAAQPVILRPDGSVQNTGWDYSEPDRPPAALTDLPRGVQPVEYPSAFALAITAELFVELDGFDPLFSNGFEDLDLAMRARAIGRGRFVVVGGSLVTHHSRFAPGRFDAEGSNLRLLASRYRPA
jgi:glycosyltransferase involved in cell wall biosynthesis